ncbi:MAG: hypothetical protein H7842_15270, partial [Gammaproteobacteria bacterium SHHR-1]
MDNLRLAVNREIDRADSAELGSAIAQLTEDAAPADPKAAIRSFSIPEQVEVLNIIRQQKGQAL